MDSESFRDDTEELKYILDHFFLNNDIFTCRHCGKCSVNLKINIEKTE